MTGGNGWCWVSSTWRFSEIAHGTVGLRALSEKTKENRVTEAREAKKKVIVDEPCNKGDAAVTDDNDVQMDDDSSENAESKNESDGITSTNVENGSGDCKMADEDEVIADKKEDESSPDKDDELPLRDEKMEVDEEVIDRKSENASLGLDEYVKDVKKNESATEVKVIVKQDKQPKKKKSAKQTRLDGIYQDFISFMINKYKEDKDAIFTLDLLKEHPKKVEEEIINVSESLQKRTHYPKMTKSQSKLDGLLERRMRQDEHERKQRLTIETQIALKLKLNQAIEAAKRKKEEREREKRKEAEKAKKLLNGDLEFDKNELSPDSSTTQKSLIRTPLPYSCYSTCHRSLQQSNAQCYSPSCRQHKAMLDILSSDEHNEKDEQKGKDEQKEKIASKENSVNVSQSINDNLEKSHDKSSEQSVNSSIASSRESNEKIMDRIKDGESLNADGKGKINEKQTSSVDESVNRIKESSGEGNDKLLEGKDNQGVGKLDTSTEDEEVDIEGEKEGSLNVFKSLSVNKEEFKTPLSTSGTSSANAKMNSDFLSSSQGESTLDSESSSKSSSVSDVVKNLVIKTMAEKAVETSSRIGVSLTSSQVLSSAIVNASLEELQAKLPKKYQTYDKFKLNKFSKVPSKKISRVSKNGRLPMCHRFETTSHHKSVLVLDKTELRKLARVGSKRESLFFNYNSKINNVCWPYPCPRPFFKTGWRYRTMTLSSLSAAALQLRILWACLRWDDMAAKPPAGGTNTVSTETEITTTELLKRREIGTDGLRSEFLVRKIVVPLGVPEKPKG